MVKNEGKANRKPRKRVIFAYARQSRWLMWVALSGTKCCFCNEVLAKDADLKTLNNITAHHILGDKAHDDFSMPADPTKLLMAHSFCHKAYHLTLRMRDQGKKVDVKRLQVMERNVAKAIKRNGRA